MSFEDRLNDELGNEPLSDEDVFGSEIDRYLTPGSGLPDYHDSNIMHLFLSFELDDDNRMFYVEFMMRPAKRDEKNYPYRTVFLHKIWTRDDKEAKAGDLPTEVSDTIERAVFANIGSSDVYERYVGDIVTEGVEEEPLPDDDLFGTEAYRIGQTIKELEGKQAEIMKRLGGQSYRGGSSGIGTGNILGTDVTFEYATYPEEPQTHDYSGSPAHAEIDVVWETETGEVLDLPEEQIQELTATGSTWD